MQDRQLSGPVTGPDENQLHSQQLTNQLHSHQLTMQPDQDYRQLEQHYRRSAQYAEMVRRYPLLRHWISACSQNELVGDPAAAPMQPDRPGVLLDWNRSHGES